MIQTKLLIIVCSFFVSVLYADAQVTIGSAAKPNSGALLDLKEFDDATALSGGRTATKGLSMPRVALKDNYSLLPLSSDDSTPNKEIHVGLTVYNTQQDVIIDEEGCSNQADFMYAGINVWDGTRWIPIGYTPVDTMAYLTKIKIVKDHEGNRYTSRKFGTAGTWMTQNLRTKTYPRNLNMSTQITVYSTSPRSTHADAIYGYPRIAKDMEITNPVDFNNTPEAGLLYSRAAVFATPGSDPGNKGDATVFPFPHQGICPEGWHIPTYAEWDALVAEIVNDLPEYTLYQANETVYSSKALLSACSLFGPTSGAKSKAALQGGFGAYFVAWARMSTGVIANNIVGEFASIDINGMPGFTGIRGELDLDVSTGLSWAESQVINVRCKKDVDD